MHVSIRAACRVCCERPNEFLILGQDADISILIRDLESFKMNTVSKSARSLAGAEYKILKSLWAAKVDTGQQTVYFAELEEVETWGSE